MWRYPLSMAWITAFLTSPGADCHVPSPRAGIVAPVFKGIAVFILGEGWRMLEGVALRMKFESAGFMVGWGNWGI
jgi:hypothetical protein